MIYLIAIMKNLKMLFEVCCNTNNGQNCPPLLSSYTKNIFLNGKIVGKPNDWHVNGLTDITLLVKRKIINAILNFIHRIPI